MSDPTRSQSRRIRSLAAASTLAAMCAGFTWRSGRDRAVQYAVHSCVMTNRPEALPKAAKLRCRLPWASSVVCEEEVRMQWWRLLLADGCPEC